MTSARAIEIVVPGSSLRLEGRLVASAAAQAGALALVAPPHPLHGGSIDSPVVHALVRAYRDAGRATLAFNFRGVGGSDGVPSGALSDARIDYLAAAQALAGYAPRWLSGYSFGSCAALLAGIALEAEHVLLVAPPLQLLDATLLTQYRGRVLVVAGDQDEYCPRDALREVFARAERLELLPGVGHFFGDEGLTMLAAALEQMLST
jgi:alpha/beta superfamily hydrolase